MAKLTIIVGVGASGKSTLCRQLAEDTEALPFEDATLTKPDHKRAGFECLGEIVARLMVEKRDCVMDESHLVDPKFRKIFKEFCDTFLKGVDQEWLFFKNNPLACINNLEHDADVGDREHLSRFEAVKRQCKSYEVPPPAEWPGFKELETVCHHDDPKFTTENAAYAWLDEQIDKLSEE